MPQRYAPKRPFLHLYDGYSNPPARGGSGAEKCRGVHINAVPILQVSQQSRAAEGLTPITDAETEPPGCNSSPLQHIRSSDLSTTGAVQARYLQNAEVTKVILGWDDETLSQRSQPVTVEARCDFDGAWREEGSGEVGQRPWGPVRPGSRVQVVKGRRWWRGRSGHRVQVVKGQRWWRGREGAGWVCGGTRGTLHLEIKSLGASSHLLSD